MDWNDAEVDWVDLETGLARAKAEDRPLVLVVYTTWCPRCLELSREWKDPALVAAAKSAIMVRMNGDTEPVANERFSPDGSYIPRTMLVNPDGSVQTDVVGPNEGYRYFHTDAATLLPLLEAARGS